MLNNKERILLLAGHYGEGHMQAASAIKAEMTRENLNVDVTMVDPSVLTHPLFDSVSRHFFIGGMKRFPSVYNFLYQKTRNQNVMSAILKRINRMGIGRLLKLLYSLQPTIIVCTCPIASGMISILKKYHFITVPTITVITDHTVHSYWVNPHVDTYIVGSDDVKRGLKQMGVNDARIVVTGIPVDPKFSQEYNRSALKLKYGMDRHLPTVLVTGGGFGMIGGDFPILKVFEKIPFDIQLIIVCGHNQRLYHRMKEERHDSKHHVLVTGYIDYLDELMAISDMMITKAGGMTLSEAITMNLPMLLYKSLGGQEQDNTEFLLKTKTALLATDMDDLYRKVIGMLTDLDLLKKLQNNAIETQQKQASFDAVQVILETLSSKTDLHFRLA